MSKSGIPQLAIYAGTFDPITFGHCDIAKRAAEIFPTVLLAVAGSTPKHPMFSTEERVQLVRAALAEVKGNFRVESFNGLLVDFAKAQQAQIIIRGLRAVSDYEYEAQMALINRQLNPEIETVFLMTSDKYSVVNSSIVRQVAANHGDVSAFVPKCVAGALSKHFQKNK